MSVSKQAQVAASSGFQWITHVQNPLQGSSHRDPAGAVVKSTGPCELNVAATEMIDLAAREMGLAADRYALLFGANPETFQIAARIVDPSVIGATMIRRNKRRHTVTIYLNQVFSEFPNLKPTAPLWCSIGLQPDGERGKMLVLYRNATLSMPATRRRTTPQPARQHQVPGPAKQVQQQAAASVMAPGAEESQEGNE